VPALFWQVVTETNVSQWGRWRPSPRRSPSKPEKRPPSQNYGMACF
jgi:hypothetical protein